PVGPVAVIIPTYNERDNIEAITGRVRSAVPDAHMLIVDDNSPDGTGEIADKLAGEDARIHVLHRAGKAGPRAADIARVWWTLGRRRGPGCGGGWSGARARWWRWTRTARTSRSSCPGYLTHWRAPISCSGHATCPAVRCVTGPGRANCCPAPATPTPG